MNRLNLLPPEIKSEIDYSKKNATLYQYLLKTIAGLAVLIVLVGVVGFIVWNNQNLATEEKNTAQIEISQKMGIESSAKDFADRLALISKLQKGKINWSNVFSEISKSTPANVRLSTFDFTNAGTERVSFSGYAVSNTDIGTFRELLSKSNFFRYVDIESTTSGTDPADSTIKVQNFKITLDLNLNEAKK